VKAIHIESGNHGMNSDREIGQFQSLELVKCGDSLFVISRNVANLIMLILYAIDRYIDDKLGFGTGFGDLACVFHNGIYQKAIGGDIDNAGVGYAVDSGDYFHYISAQKGFASAESNPIWTPAHTAKDLGIFFHRKVLSFLFPNPAGAATGIAGIEQANCIIHG
jgi:hypothetical protein